MIGRLDVFTTQISTLLSAIKISSSSLISGTRNDSQGGQEIFFSGKNIKINSP